MKRYEIYWAVLDPTIGTEIKKTRPCVIISPDIMNERLLRVIIAPITSSVRAKLPFRHTIHQGGQDRDILLDQIRTIDKQRLQRRIGRLQESDKQRLALLLQALFAA